MDGDGEAAAPRLSACRRYTLLAVSVFAVFSGYFNFDLPSITSKQLKAPPLSLSNTQLGLLFSVYAIPNTFLPLISGAFLQRVGVWNGVLSIAALKSSGVILVNIGIAASSYPVVLLGRILVRASAGGEGTGTGRRRLAGAPTPAPPSAASAVRPGRRVSVRRH